VLVAPWLSRQHTSFSIDSIRPVPLWDGQGQPHHSTRQTGRGASARTHRSPFDPSIHRSACPWPLALPRAILIGYSPRRRSVERTMDRMCGTVRPPDWLASAEARRRRRPAAWLAGRLRVPCLAGRTGRSPRTRASPRPRTGTTLAGWEGIQDVARGGRQVALLMRGT